jgi:hypothetical protein
MTAFPSVLLRMRNVCNKSCIENQTTVLCPVTPSLSFFFVKNHTTYEMMWEKKTARQTTDDNITQCTHFACWRTKATGTSSEYTMLIAFPRQQ